jgi:Tfp pilus assembly protein PilN
MEPNISDPAVLESRVQALLGSGRRKTEPITLVLADLSVRAALLELDEVPARPAERDALVRWKMQQDSVFPLTGVRVVSQPLSSKSVLALAVRETVLRQYEGVCESVGLAPVSVDIAGFRLRAAMADSLPAREPVAWLSLLDGGFTLFIHHAGRLTFLRIKRQSGGEGVFGDLAASLAYYAETHPQDPPSSFMVLDAQPEYELTQRVTNELGLRAIPVNGNEIRPRGWVTGDGLVPVAAWPAVAGHIAKQKLRRRAGGSAASTGFNFSSGRRSYVGSLRVALAVVAVFCMGLTAQQILQSRTIDAQILNTEQRLARVMDMDSRLRQQAQMEGLDLSDASLQRLPREVAFANQVITKHAFSWTRFLTDLEEAVPPGVRIHGIHLDVKESMITVAGSALSLKDLTALIIGLEDHRAFRDAVLGQHRVTENNQVEFGLTVRYQSPGTASTK